jgi:hypothetical protein
MNAEQIRQQIRKIAEMTYSETVNNQQRILALALWEIALQLARIFADIQENAANQDQFSPPPEQQTGVRK